MKIQFETAKLAKLKGYNLPENTYYIQHKDGEVNIDNGDGDSEFICLDHNKYDDYYSAPAQSDLQKWLLNVHYIKLYEKQDLEIELQKMLKRIKTK